VIQSATEDLPDAYRHMPVQPAQHLLHILAVRDPHTGDFLLQEHYGMIFGLSGSVIRSTDGRGYSWRCSAGGWRYHGICISTTRLSRTSAVVKEAGSKQW